MCWPSVGSYTCYPELWEAKAGKSQVPTQPGKHNLVGFCLQIKSKKGWGHSSMVECLPEVLSLISCTTRKKQDNFSLLRQLLETRHITVTCPAFLWKSCQYQDSLAGLAWRSQTHFQRFLPCAWQEGDPPRAKENLAHPSCSFCPSSYCWIR